MSKTIADTERALVSLLDKSSDRAKALEIAFIVLGGIAREGEAFTKALDECLKDGDKEALLKFLYEREA